MTVSGSAWARFIDMLAAISNTAARKFEAYLNTHETASSEGRRAAVDYASALSDRYGESAAAVACQMYDAVAEASGAKVPPAVPAMTATYSETAKVIYGIMKESNDAAHISSGVGRLVKQAGVDTSIKNAIRDNAEFAWIPSGDSCAFCLMLASNGWQRASRHALNGGHAEHIHANCDCTYAIRFSKDTQYDGYDPDKYREMYDNAEGDTWREKLNSMRRDEYAANADKIRAQKREEYARRKDLKEGNNPDRINKKLSDRLLDSNIEYAQSTFDFEEIEQAVEASSIGRTASGYIQKNGMIVNLDYSLDNGDLDGEVIGNDIYIYAANHKTAKDASATLIHEICHIMYGWDRTQEDEVNCRLMEIYHRTGNITDNDIRRVVAFVKEFYSEFPEGELYGYR